jgi:hypothetical protein
MPLVFVHGVNVRASSSFYEEVEVRNAFFRRFVLDSIATDGPLLGTMLPFRKAILKATDRQHVFSEASRRMKRGCASYQRNKE